MSNKLYVGNLPYRTREEEVLHLLEAAGTVVSCHLVVDRVTSLSKGFAFVEMASQEDAARAIAWFDGKEHDGRLLRVNEARPRATHVHAEAGGGDSDGDWRTERRWRY